MEWPKVKIGDVCTLVSGNSLSDEILLQDGEIPYVKVAELNMSKNIPFITTSRFFVDSSSISAKQIFPEGTVIFPKRGGAIGTNKKRIVHIPICADLNIMGVIPNAEINSKYLYYFFENIDFATLYNGSSVPQINNSDIAPLTISLPTYDIQSTIVKKLDKVSDLIALHKQQLAKLDELVKARFVEMFGDPKLNNRGWESGVVSDYFDVKGGKRIPKGMGYSGRKTNHPYLRATDMKNETIIEDDIHYIDEDVFQHIKRYTVKGGDIYLTNVGVNLGMAGVIPQKFDGASLTENAVKLVPKSEKVIDGLFLAHYINSPGIQEYINERKMSVGVPKLAIFRIETMPLLIPPMDIQQDFNTFVEHTDKSKSEIQTALTKLETLKKALMQQYFG